MAMNAADLADALGYLDANATTIHVTGAMALLLGFVQYGEAIRVGFRDRTHAVPLIGVLFQLANDASYSLHYARWFHVVQHPFFTQQWFLIFPFTVLELTVGWQIVTYSRHEVFPGLSKAEAWVTFGALAIAMFVIHRYIASTSGDYLSEKTNMMTLLFSNLGIYLLARRRSGKGQSMLLAIVLIFCAGIPQFFFMFPAMGPPFRTPQFYALGVVVCLAGLIYPVMLLRAGRTAIASHLRQRHANSSASPNSVG